MRTLSALLILLCACTSADDDGADTDDTDRSPDDRAFVRIPDTPPADVDNERLCVPSDDSQGRVAPADMDCATESYRHATETEAPDGPLVVMAFNIERGLKLDAVFDAFDAGELPMPDLLLMSEVDRGCSRTGSRDVPREIAEHLGMDGVYAVEFVELPRGAGSGGNISETCEHGNALFSRYPLGNAGFAFHEANLDWYLPPDQRDGGEPRLGGRSFVWADAQVGDRLVRLVSIHFESRPESWGEVHTSQAAESADKGLQPGGPAIVGGDTNFPAYTLDLSRADGTILDPGAEAILTRGFVDSHAELPFDARPTRSGLVIDLMFGKDVTFSDPAVCAANLCDTLGDHQAVWADVDLDAPGRP